MSYFIKSGNTYRVTSKDAMDLHEALPAGNYVLKQDQHGNFFLEGIDAFTSPKKIYGDCLKNTDRIIRTFADRDSSTGIMLTGEKGSGKTLLTKNISIQLAAQGIPTIVINTPFRGDGFNTFIQDIDQPCAVLFDEFEKVFDKDEQEQILTLLDGVFPTKKLFMLTCNDKWRVDQHMRNRPGRIFYMIDFKGLEDGFIREYCEDNLNAKQYIDKICNIATLFAEFNFDMLKALVEDMNRYNETPQEALRILNAKPEFDGGSSFEVKLLVDGIEPKGELHPTRWEGNPMQRGVTGGYDTDPEDNSADWENFEFSPNELVTVDARAGKFVFQQGNKKLILTKIREKHFDLGAF